MAIMNELIMACGQSRVAGREWPIDCCIQHVREQALVFLHHAMQHLALDIKPDSNDYAAFRIIQSTYESL